MKKTGKEKMHIGIDDYVKAIKIADRELDQENATGFKSVDKVHKSKKTYKRNKKIDINE